MGSTKPSRRAAICDALLAHGPMTVVQLAKVMQSTVCAVRSCLNKSPEGFVYVCAVEPVGNTTASVYALGPIPDGQQEVVNDRRARPLALPLGRDRSPRRDAIHRLLVARGPLTVAGIVDELGGTHMSVMEVLEAGHNKAVGVFRIARWVPGDLVWKPVWGAATGVRDALPPKHVRDKLPAVDLAAEMRNERVAEIESAALAACKSASADGRATFWMGL